MFLLGKEIRALMRYDKSVSLSKPIIVGANNTAECTARQASEAPPRVGTDQLKELKKVQRENEQLRRAVADLTLDKLILAEAAKGNF